MKIETFDNIVDFETRNNLFRGCKTSPYSLGWKDNNLLEDSPDNLHCYWNIETLNQSGLVPYLNNIQSKYFKFDINKVVMTEVNLVRSDDVYYTHTHPGQWVALYYANLNWEDGWYGETIFYDKQDQNKVIFTNTYTPGRISFIDGSIPHAVRPQSIKGPKFRFSVSIFSRY